MMLQFPPRPFSGTLTTVRKRHERPSYACPHDLDRLPVEGEIELVFKPVDSFDEHAKPDGIFEYRGAIHFPPRTFHPTAPDQTMAASCLFGDVFRLEMADGLTIDLIFVHVAGELEPNVATAKFRSSGAPISVPADECAAA